MSTLPATHVFQTALLLVDTEANAAVDRHALRELGIKVRTMTSGVKAALLLAGHNRDEQPYQPDIIFCHKKLTDMSGLQFISLLRLHPLLLGKPVLLISNDNDADTRLDALASGSSGVLVRPYSQGTLLKTLHTLAGNSEQTLKQGLHDLGTAAFDAALQRFGRVTYDSNYGEQAFNTGLKALQQRQWDAAITAFQRAMRQIALKGESELGLAAAWHGKGDMVKYRHYLQEAGLTFARAQRWHRARVTYTRLLRVDPKADSPFLAVAERHIRAESFEQAAEALAAGYDLGVLTGLPDKLVQACLTTNNPDQSVENMLRALSGTSIAAATSELGGGMREALAEAETSAQRRSRELAARSAAAARAARREKEVVAALDDDFDDDLLAEDSFKNTPLLTIAPEPNASQKAHGIPLMPLPNASDALSDALNVKDMESTFFTAFPVLNEMLTVIRVTCGLLRNTQKKN